MHYPSTQYAMANDSMNYLIRNYQMLILQMDHTDYS
jgi:hypothetical protein